MLTDEEKRYINEKLNLNVDFDNMSDDDWIRIEDAVGDRLTLHCLGKDYEPNDEGRFCYAILDKLNDD